MKSTVKIDLLSREDNSTPAIKIIQPIDQPLSGQNYGVINVQDDDLDVRDKLVRDFLNRPGYAKRNNLFRIAGYYPNNKPQPTAHITFIEPIRHEDLGAVVRQAILERMVASDFLEAVDMPQDTPNDIDDFTIYQRETYKKINEFFDWVNKEGGYTLLK